MREVPSIFFFFSILLRTSKLALNDGSIIDFYTISEKEDEVDLNDVTFDHDPSSLSHSRSYIRVFIISIEKNCTG